MKHAYVNELFPNGNTHTLNNALNVNAYICTTIIHNWILKYLIFIAPFSKPNVPSLCGSRETRTQYKTKTQGIKRD